MQMYKNLLEKLVFPRNETGLVLIAAKTVSNEENRGGFDISDINFPSHCQIIRLSNDVSFLAEAKEVIARSQPRHLFIVPPFISNRELPEGLKRLYPRESLETIAVRELIDFISDNTTCGVLLPHSTLSQLSSLAFRQEIVEQHSVQWVIEHLHAPNLLGIENVHHGFRLCTVILGPTHSQPPKINFVRITPELANGSSSILRTIDQLQTNDKVSDSDIGYAYSGKLSDEFALFFELYHPERLRRFEQVTSHFGAVKPLVELVDYIPTFNIFADAHLLIEFSPDTSSDLVPVISGRCILPNGTLEPNNSRYQIQWANLESKYELRSGDLCLRSIHDVRPVNSTIPMVEILDSHLPVVADNSVIVMRPKPTLGEDEREMLRSYTRTQYLSEQLRALGNGINISKYHLNKVQIPIHGVRLKQALHELSRAEQALKNWLEEIESTRQNLFSIPQDREASIRTLSRTRRVRQRYRAASQVDDFSSRVSTGFPLPIAGKWRTIVTSPPDYEGYKHILECAEIAIAFVACIGMMLAAEQRLELGSIRDGVSGGKVFGFWKKVLAEVQTNFSKISEEIPFAEVTRFPNTLMHEQLNQKGEQAYKSLHNARNKDAHGEGPKGIEVAGAFHAAFDELQSLLQCMEFVIEYPLIYIERTRHDTQTSQIHCEFRELMGDHHLVPIQRETYPKSFDLEAESLYLVDRQGKPHLLRPFLLYQQSIKGNRSAVYYLNKYDPKKDICELRSLDIGDTIELQGIAQQFFHANLIVPNSPKGP